MAYNRRWLSFLSSSPSLSKNRAFDSLCANGALCGAIEIDGREQNQEGRTWLESNTGQQEQLKVEIWVVSLEKVQQAFF